MSEEEVQKSEESSRAELSRKRRRYFTRRNGIIVGGLLAVLIVVLGLLSVVLYRYGTFDTYIKAQFVAKMEYMGVVFDADVFRLTVNPLQLELKNATFNDRVSGEKLFFIRDARVGLSVDNLFSWQLSRDVKVESTEIFGAEAWVKFDENGRSNFANLVEDTRASNLNFKYNSIKFSMRDSVVHFGDLSRTITADANNIELFLEPENFEIPDEQKRYKINFASTDSDFTYGEGQLNDISIRATGIADGKGADISELRIETPIGMSVLSGKVIEWTSPKYDLNIESTVDLTQASTIFPLGATLRGVGNFKGRVTGEGETYNIDGQADSEALSAEGIYLRGFNVAATVAGTNTNYEANGNAVAELLTFEDFRIEFPKMAGNVRGTGSDFRWVGELQAAAAKAKSLTIVGLFLRDAVAEYKDRQFSASAGNGRAQKFAIADTEFANLNTRGLKFAQNGDAIVLTAPNATADSFKTEDYKLNGVSGRNLTVKNQDGRTDVSANSVESSSADIKGTKLKNLKADDFQFTDKPATSDLTAKNVRAERLDANGARIEGLAADSVTLNDNQRETIVYSDKLRVAKVDAGGAVLGNLNIAGVRLTIRQGRVEGTSQDIDAGTVTLAKSTTLPEGGKVEGVKIAKPVFILEPSGRYRASADMSIGGGVVGSIPLGNATAKVNVNNDRVELNDLNASVMDGSVNGTATIAFNARNQSQVNANFTNLDLSKIVALQAGRVVAFDGNTTGRADITFNGTDFRSTSGTIQADITANAGSADKGTVPVNGRIELSATNGLFNVDAARLNTQNSQLTATGRFDLRNDDSNLDIALNSTDANEIDRLVRVLGVSPDLESQLDSLQLTVAGNLNFNGKLTGNLTDPTIDGRASLASVSLRGREVGSISTDIFVSPTGTELRNGKLQETGTGGTVAFSVSIPSGGANNTSVQAELTNVNAGNLIAALPVDLPEQLRDFSGTTSGTVNLSGLPNQSQGEINLSSTSGSIAGQAFDSLKAKAVFSGTLVTLESGEIRVGDGYVSAKGTYERTSTAFNLDLDGKNVPLPLALSFLPKGETIPTFSGLADFTAKAVGEYDRPSSYNINFNGAARDVVVNENTFGAVEFKGTTTNQVLNADLTATLDGRPQKINASVNFGDGNMPFRVETAFDKSPLAPFFALVPQLQGIPLSGIGTGTVEFGGNLSRLNDKGEREMSTAGLTGTARFSQLDLQIQDTPLSATEPVVVRFSPKEIDFVSARFAGGGSNLVVAGVKALTDDGINSLAVDGRLNLALLNAIPQVAASDTFFGGFADVAIRLSGVNATSRISGTATMQNAAVAAFIGSSRLTFDRLQGRILFTSNQAQIESATGYLGGGKFNASGGALFVKGLQLDSFRVALDGTNITVPLPEDFITTGDANLEFSGRRTASNNLLVQIAGNIRARRSLYSKDIELSNIVGGRREGSLSSGASSILAPRFDLTIEGRDALVVKNNIADLTASVSLRLTGSSDNPQISGRITANSGTVFFRKDRYIVQRGVLEFPPNTAIEPVISLQAETEIQGYQIFVNLSGPLTDTESLNASVRSSPALPSQDVLSLITTGSLSNTEGGLPTFAQTGINTAAEILTDSIINEPARKATDKLFGLNVFEIDPIISGQRLNPSARLTVGRQINNNLRVTYATNLSQDQNQVLALEYRVSNKLSFVAQYEQRSLSNVTRNRDNFSLEVRFRRRF
jgi:translocation and assembly module TamB